MTRLIYISILLLLSTIWGYTQTREKIDLNDGVTNYERGKYQDAQTSFEKAYAENPNYARALYNAGNSAYLAGNFDTAMIYYNDYADKIKSKKEIAKAHFNIGNANLQKAAKAESSQETAKNAQAFYKEAINAYKQSLKNNPSDIEAKYNLTYALDKLQKNQEQQDQEGDQNKENQDEGDKGDQGDKGDKGDQQNNEDGEQGDKGEDENQNDEKGDKEEGDQNGKEESDEEGDKEDDPNGKPEDGEEEEGQGNQGNEGDKEDEQPVDGQISKAQAIKDLDAINADEGKILQKVYQKKGDKKSNNNSDKDW